MGLMAVPPRTTDLFASAMSNYKLMQITDQEKKISDKNVSKQLNRVNLAAQKHHILDEVNHRFLDCSPGFLPIFG